LDSLRQTLLAKAFLFGYTYFNSMQMSLERPTGIKQIKGKASLTSQLRCTSNISLSAPIKRQQHPCRPLIAASSQTGGLQLALRLSRLIGSYLAMSLLLCIEKSV